jgi:hypothetical protein
MSVQINNGKVADQSNGLSAIELDLLRFTDSDRITAVVTYKVTKQTHDLESGDDYPVIKATHIEPILSAEALAQAKELQQAAYQLRTGETQLSLYPSDEDTQVDDGSPVDVADPFDVEGGDAA